MGDDVKTFMELFEPLRNQVGGAPLGKFGGHWLPVYLPVFWDKMRNFPVRPDDVLICSFPKTGTNWVHFLVYMIQTGNIEQTKDDYRIMLFERPVRGGYAGLDSYAADTNLRRIITHLPANLLPIKAFDGRVIYIYRDVKDTVVSYYYMAKGIMTSAADEYKGTFEEFVRRFMQGEVHGGPYDTHLKAFWEAKKAGKPLLFLRYENLKKDINGGIRQIAEFLGKTLDDDTIKRVAEAASVEKMRANDAVNWRKIGALKPGNELIRKGEVGDWRNHFTDAGLLAEFDAYVKKNYPMELFPDFE